MKKDDLDPPQERPVRTVFALTNGRSGTAFLSSLLRRNARGAFVVHEPYLCPGNPTMFGQPIFDRHAGDLDAIRSLLARKRRTIRGYGKSVYVEMSHAFLKSWSDLAPEYFSEMKLLHLIRHPLLAARSLANREEYLERIRLPYRNYRAADGRKYFRWSLTGLEPIYGHFESLELSPFQRYLIEWIEVENRAIGFLDRFGLQAECVTLHVPGDLNDASRIQATCELLGIERNAEKITLRGRRNRTPGAPTRVGDREVRECREVVERLPEQTLAVFRREPYAGRDWVRYLGK